MQPYRPARRRAWFWLLVAGLAVFMSLEPSLFLVTLALGLSALALFWVLLLARLLVLDALRALPKALSQIPPPKDAPQ